MSRKPLVIGAVLAAVALLAAAVPFTVVRARRPESCRTAIALRDRVPFEQMLGTRLFTMPWLLAGYEHPTYVEATDDDDGRARVLAALEAARIDGCEVDLLFLAHGDDFSAWLEALEPTERPMLGLVYDTGAGDARQGERWLDVGARAFVGHPGANLAPIFYGFFLPTWLSGASIEDAVASSNAKTFVTIDSLRPYLGADTGLLWRGTRAVAFGDPRFSR